MGLPGVAPCTQRAAGREPPSWAAGQTSASRPSSGRGAKHKGDPASRWAPGESPQPTTAPSSRSVKANLTGMWTMKASSVGPASQPVLSMLLSGRTGWGGGVSFQKANVIMPPSVKIPPWLPSTSWSLAPACRSPQARADFHVLPCTILFPCHQRWSHPVLQTTEAGRGEGPVPVSHIGESRPHLNWKAGSSVAAGSPVLPIGPGHPEGPSLPPLLFPLHQGTALPLAAPTWLPAPGLSLLSNSPGMLLPL